MLNGIGAGFEVGKVGGRCLATETRHVPESDMLAHYSVALSHGCSWARDGLPPDTNLAARFAAVRTIGLTVVWDILHQWETERPVAYARQIAEAWRTNGNGPLWVCANEPAIMPMFTSWSRGIALAAAMLIIRVLKEELPDVRVLTTDPFRDGSDGEFAATDALVQAGMADVIGCNCYPHTLLSDIEPILSAARIRYGAPVVLAETSWHDGFHLWPSIENKGDWFRFAEAECERAGADGMCWYPFVDSPDWNVQSNPRWSHGLYREDGSVDEALSAAMMEAA